MMVAIGKVSMVEIRKIKLEHIDDIVKVHINAFPDFFLTFLGPKFLREFYKSFIVSYCWPAYARWILQKTVKTSMVGLLPGKR